MSNFEDLIKKYCPDSVEYVPIGSLMERVKEKGKDDLNIKQVYVVSNMKGIVRSEDYHDNSIHSDDTSNYTILKQDMFAYNPSRLNIGSIGRLKNKISGLVSPMYVVFSINKSLVDVKYFEYFIKSPKIINKIDSLKEEGARFRFDYNRWNWINIPLPPIEVQKEIVRILDTFTGYQDCLNEELTLRKKQYEYYRDKLLTFGDNVPLKKLGDIAIDIYRGTGIKKDEVTEKGIPCVRYGEIYTKYNIWFDRCFSHTIEENIKNGKYFEYGDVLFAITGESVKDISKSCVYIGNDKCLAGGDIVVLKHDQNPKYMGYVLSTTNAQIQKSKGKVKSKVVHSNVQDISDIIIPVPPLEEQERIVKILDRFDALCNDISSGLPAEIEMRKKQYEYYRDKLLTFKEKKV
ncbi:restriction endonuclease subunit S [Brachyspira pulli]|uniref:restriction endonuclease subunit S n=1 Tax=Brachyspira pulli TaxID=310721 RepID=UPI00300523BB